MTSPTSDEPKYVPLTIDNTVAREIAQEVNRLFQLHTENISLHFSPTEIVIHVYAPVEETFTVELSDEERRAYISRR